MHHIAYYISGQGYGHAVRSIEVIKSLSKKNPYLFFHIKTSAPEWFFSLNLDCNYLYYELENDIGTVEHSFHEVDKRETLRKLTTLFSPTDKFLEDETAFLLQNNVNLVIGDIPPGAFVAASKAGIPSVAIGNFSWDWIYGHFLEDEPQFAPLINQVRNGYAQADLLLRLPMHGPMSAFKNTIEIPLIVRRARRKDRDVRRMFRIEDDGKKLVLVALRPSELKQVNFQKLSVSPKYKFIVLNLQKLVPGMLNLPQNLMPFQELVNACDIVVSKLGYGIVSECIANKTRLVFPDKTECIETGLHVEELSRNGIGEKLSRTNFLKGNWTAALNRAIRREWPVNSRAMNGADVAAGHIERFLREKVWTESRAFA